MTADAPENAEILAAKREMRGQARARRRELEAAHGDGAAAAALAGLLSSGWLAPGAAVSAYWTLPGEFDVRPLLEELYRRGHPCLLPAVVAKGEPLAFRRWRPGMALVGEGLGVEAPPAGTEERRPDLLLVPLLAFDAEGYRLGYGGGYYDRTLAALRADGRGSPLAVGIAFSGQEVPAVPHLPRDRKLDALLSEAGARHFAGRV
jgi:5-formyltetrahydrofolate cyclo-ligase